MAKRKTSHRKKARSRKKQPTAPQIFLRSVRRWLVRGGLVFFAFFAFLMILGIVFNPWTTPYMYSESRRLDKVAYEWVPMEKIAPVMARAVVAAEDANYCTHWGFDVRAIQEALEAGGNRGASTISQQTVKNVFLWHGRNYTRKALEALLTPMLELFWSKRRVLEVYLNIAEFDEGVFGVKAAAQHYFGADPDDLTDVQAARLAAILPDPKGRSASKPSSFVRKRAQQILSGAATISKDERSACFES